jgi:hypothetical protein
MKEENGKEKSGTGEGKELDKRLPPSKLRELVKSRIKLSASSHPSSPTLAIKRDTYSHAYAHTQSCTRGTYPSNA